MATHHHKVWFPLHKVESIQTNEWGETIIKWKPSGGEMGFIERRLYGQVSVRDFLEKYRRETQEEGRVVSKKVLYEKYETFEKENNRSPISKIMFSKLIRIDPYVKDAHINGERHWIFPAVELRK